MRSSRVIESIPIAIAMGVVLSWAVVFKQWYWWAIFVAGMVSLLLPSKEDTV